MINISVSDITLREEGKINGYTLSFKEKIEIAKRHLIPKEKEANGIADEKITFSKQAIEHIIEDYTRESGVRTLEKKIGKIVSMKDYKGFKAPYPLEKNKIY